MDSHQSFILWENILSDVLGFMFRKNAFICCAIVKRSFISTSHCVSRKGVKFTLWKIYLPPPPPPHGTPCENSGYKLPFTDRSFRESNVFSESLAHHYSNRLMQEMRHGLQFDYNKAFVRDARTLRFKLKFRLTTIASNDVWQFNF